MRTKKQLQEAINDFAKNRIEAIRHQYSVSNDIELHTEVISQEEGCIYGVSIAHLFSDAELGKYYDFQFNTQFSYTLKFFKYKGKKVQRDGDGYTWNGNTFKNEMELLSFLHTDNA